MNPNNLRIGASGVAGLLSLSSLAVILLSTPMVSGNLDLFQSFNTAQKILLIVVWGLMGLAFLLGFVQTIVAAREFGRAADSGQDVARSAGTVVPQLLSFVTGVVVLVVFLIYTLYA